MRNESAYIWNYTTFLNLMLFNANKIRKMQKLCGINNKPKVEDETGTPGLSV